MIVHDTLRGRIQGRSKEATKPYSKFVRKSFPPMQPDEEAKVPMKRV